MSAPHTIFPRLLADMGNLYHELVPTQEASALTTVFIMCAGITGCGTSTFINQLINTSADPDTALMEVGEGLSSCTKHVHWTQVAPQGAERWAENYNILVCDVPGFNQGADRAIDSGTLQEFWTSLHERVQQSTEPCLLRILILKDITADRETWPGFNDDLALIQSTVDSKVLKQLTVVTTKWARESESSGIRVFEDRQSQIQKSLQALLSEGTVLDACKTEDDAWRIIRELIERENPQQPRHLFGSSERPLLTGSTARASRAFAVETSIRNDLLLHIIRH
ncbi:hypothetical protein NMY22_g5293 [Coprinellus aureogranulatus]|nr:hypothetical protein NMY22_g5293 [Coprinellus aureogranulatus]